MFLALAALAGFAVSGAEGSLPGYNGFIAFASSRPSYTVGDIWVMAPDGTGQRNLTNDGVRVNGSPAWSPDGTEIAYVRDGAAFGSEIWIMNADGSNEQRLTSGYYDGSPAWSPDGTRIAFDSTRPYTASAYAHHIWVMNRDGSDPVQLTDDSSTLNHVGADPDWSPDGARITFDDSGDVYTMNSDGTGVTRLTTDAVRDWDPMFSP
ncbi:MAG: hypothetical protein E6G24_09175, partial [Actinobacteria bacterium]